MVSNTANHGRPKYRSVASGFVADMYKNESRIPPANRKQGGRHYSKAEQSINMLDKEFRNMNPTAKVIVNDAFRSFL